MSGIFNYTPAIWPPLVAAGLLVVIGLYAWRHHDVPGGKPFVWMSAGSILVLLGIMLEAAAVLPAAKIAAFKFQYVVIVACIAPVTCLVLDYAQPERWLTRRNLVLLNVPSLVLLVLTLVDDSRLVWRRLDLLADGSIQSYFAPAGTLITAYGFSMLLLYLVVFVRLFIRSPQHRWPIGVILLGQVASRTAFYLDTFHFKALSFVDLSVITVLLPWTAYAIAIFGFHILDPLPTARRAVIEQMYAGMVVFDAKWRLVSLNPAAERILGLRNGAAHGKTWQQLVPQVPLPALPDGRRLSGDAPETLEMAFGAGAERRLYETSLSPLRDSRGLLLGYLLVLQDVTEQRRSQAQILEQQRALAMLNEHEQLARELHDGLGQELAAAHLQASTARKLLDRGETAQVAEYLNILKDTTLQAEADMREYLLGVQSVGSADQPLLATLREYLKRFTHQYGLPVELSVLPELEGQDLPMTAAIQLLRIIQEGLSNIRKHARARCAQVSLTVSGPLLQVIISDDGLGFDASAVVTQPAAGFGLRSMRERAEALGGVLQIDSNQGKGTRLMVEVPLGSEP